MNLDEERYGILLSEESPPLINIGTGEDVTIRELAKMVARVVGFQGELIFDAASRMGRRGSSWMWGCCTGSGGGTARSLRM